MSQSHQKRFLQERFGVMTYDVRYNLRVSVVDAFTTISNTSRVPQWWYQACMDVSVDRMINHVFIIIGRIKCPVSNIPLTHTHATRARIRRKYAQERDFLGLAWPWDEVSVSSHSHSVPLQRKAVSFASKWTHSFQVCRPPSAGLS